MKIFGFFGVFSSAQELEFDLSRFNITSTRSNVLKAFWDVGSDVHTAAVFADEYDYMYSTTYYSTIFVNGSWEYGCWGQIKDDEISPGYGEPVDEIDHLFRDWKRCRECLDLDFGREIFFVSDYWHLRNVFYRVTIIVLFFE